MSYMATYEFIDLKDHLGDLTTWPKSWLFHMAINEFVDLKDQLGEDICSQGQILFLTFGR